MEYSGFYNVYGSKIFENNKQTSVNGIFFKVSMYGKWYTILTY